MLSTVYMLYKYIYTVCGHDKRAHECLGSYTIKKIFQALPFSETLATSLVFKHTLGLNLNSEGN